MLDITPTQNFLTHKETMRTATITLNTHHLAHNLGILKNQTSARLLAMVKANAYGHGIALAAHMQQADGFGVATLAEARELHHVLSSAAQNPPDNRPIVLIEGVFSADEWHTAVAYDFSSLIHCNRQLQWALDHPPRDGAKAQTVWLKFNTGMNRLGFCQEDILRHAQSLIEKNYRIVLISHFACADDKAHPLNTTQITQFCQVLSTLQARHHHKIQASLCNSAGMVNFPYVHFDWVRSGIALYGSTPVIDKTAHDLNLKPVMSLSAKVMALHTTNARDTVGYGALYTARAGDTIAIISLGYGDGYPRVVTDAAVAINQQLYPIVGRVSMDMIAVAVDSHVKIDDEVQFWGDQISIDTLAQCANTLSYELFCRLTNRPTRILV